MSFQSATEIENKRQQLREARQTYLAKAKEEYENEEQKKARAKARGENTWMLTSVNQRLDNEQQSLEKSKKKKKKKDKQKKKKRKKHSSSGSDSDSEDGKSRKKKSKKKKKKESSSSSSDSDDDQKWVEKTTDGVAATPTAVKGPKLERDSWMSAPPDLFATVTRQDLIDKKKKEKEELDKQRELLNKPGTHAKEINPYWKDGGTGLPEECKEMPTVTKALNVGDAGLSWLKKSYDRCVQQAKEEGRSLEELAAERWGSLEAIQKQIKEAEDAKYGRSRPNDRSTGQKSRFMRPSDDDDHRSQSRYSRKRSKTPDRSDRSKSFRSRSRSKSRSRDRHRSRSHDRKSRSREHRSSRERRRSRSRDRHRSRSHDRRSKSRERRRSRSRDRSGTGMSSFKGRFMRPGEMSEKKETQSRSQTSSDRAPAWKKKEFQKPVEEEQERKSETQKDAQRGRSREEERKSRRRQSSSESSFSSDSSSSSSDEDKRQSSSQKQSTPPVKLLSEKEMNELGAKILKAEIMGNEEQAAKLKAQLEAAREAIKNAPAAPRGQGQSRKEDDEFVTLTRTDRSGMARPVPEGQYPAEIGGKRRRKKQKVETHKGKQGERTKYFDDDDKFDLKTLVEREKMGTAEDQNQMFARLAGRAAQRTDDEFQVDDIFLNKANQKQSDSIQEQRDRAAAIFEHRKMAASLEKCQFCFGNVPKHLIIAIGSKVYLCLPNHRSLTEGHCLIVPMQHTASSTAVDEDVWSEVQVFRKTLTKMFGDRDEDVVFMETSMRLKHFPHMSIECVPMEKEVGDMAPVYFKKAIQESESEWSQNKKVVDLSKKDIRHSVPKGFPYFSVDFGNEGGFAHVIEDEQRFPHYFGREIVGGMIDSDHRLWRKPPKENFDEQRKKVLKFAEMWKPYDWTQNISKNVNGDSSSSDSD